MLVKKVDTRWSLGEGVGGGDRGVKTSHHPCLAFAASGIFVLGFLPSAQTIFRCQNLIKDFACLISEGKCSQNSLAIAEAGLACGNGTVGLFEIRISKGRGQQLLQNLSLRCEVVACDYMWESLSNTLAVSPDLDCSCKITQTNHF